MKNGLIIFGITLPFLLLQDFVFNRQIPLLGGIVFAIPFVSLNFLIKKQLPQIDSKEILKKVFLLALNTGLFYALWVGSYHYIVNCLLKPEYISVQLEALKSAEILGRKFTTQELEMQFKVLKSPFSWILSALFFYSMLFSILGLIFGYLYKSKVNKK